MDEERSGFSGRAGCDVRVGSGGVDGPVCANRTRRWADRSARGAVGGRSQRIPRGADVADAAAARDLGVEVEIKRTLQTHAPSRTSRYELIHETKNLARKRLIRKIRFASC